MHLPVARCMDRRSALRTLAVLGTCCFPLASLAQQQGRVWRIGMVHGVSPALTKVYLEFSIAGMTERGYAQGKNFAIDSLSAEGDPNRYPALVDDILQRKPDLLIGANTAVALLMKARTRTIPIVLATSGDPVGDGLVQGLARPGGNVTGVSLQLAELGSKHIEVLSDLLPRMSRAAVLVDPAASADQTEQYEARARLAADRRQAAIELHRVGAEEKVADVFRRIAAQKPDALAVFLSPRLNARRREIAEHAVRLRLPSIAHPEGFAEDGGLVSYGPSFNEAWRQSAYFVDRIMKGADPATLPIEQPRKFIFYINGRTAKALGLKIPQSVLFRADKVIE